MTVKIAKLGYKLRGTRFRWYGRVRREEGYVGKIMIEMAIPGKRKREGHKRRWMDLMRKDIRMIGAREGDKVDRVLSAL